ncbi:putative RNA recognition motif domain, nucleotide-binding alpha-beta plait domain superfamily [Plasmopara halstedii]
MEGLGVVYEQEEPVVDTQQTPAGDNQTALTSVSGDDTEDDDDIRALAGNPDDLDTQHHSHILQQQQQQQQQHQQQQQQQQQPLQYQQHQQDFSGGYSDYVQTSGQHPQQQMEQHHGYDKNGGSTQPGKLFIGGVSWETTEDTLRQHFGKYGALTDAALMKDKYTGQPRGFGFVTFADASAIDRVLEETHTLDGRSVEVKRAIPRERTAPGSSEFRGARSGYSSNGGGGGGIFTESKKIFVGGLAPTIAEQDFRHYFEEFGRITDAVVMIDRDTQRSRGFGFITFEDESSVAEVISKNHEIHGKSVEIKRAEPKEARSGGGGGYSGGRGGRGGGWRAGGRGGGGGGAAAAASYGGGYSSYGGGYGGGYSGGYGGGYGAGYGAAAGYGAGGYGGYPQAYAGYGYGGYGGRGGYGYGGYGGYAGYNAGGAGSGGDGGEDGGYSEEVQQGQGGQQSTQVGVAPGYGYGGGYRQGGGSSGAQGASGGRSDRYRPY